MSSALDHAMIDKIAAEIDDELIGMRRDIHRHPELAGEEWRTSALVAERLRAAGLAVVTGVGGHGVVAVLDGAGEGPTVAYRADMDAVDDDELFDCAFASRVPGAAHLCGHDLHTAIGVGIALVLARLRKQLNGRVVFVFQPAEETCEGARAMIEDGALERTAPREIYALHCGPLPVGTFAVGPGQPGQDRFRIELAGPGADDAKRLVTMIEGLSTVGRPQTPGQFQRLMDDLQTPGGPLASFVYALAYSSSGDDGARVHAFLRAWPESRYAEIREGVRRWVGAIPCARVQFTEQPFPAMVSSPDLSAAAATYLRCALGEDAVTVLHAAFPFNGDDFAYFLHQVPGAMFYLGVANPATGLYGVPHSPDFAADEHAIGIGVRAMVGFLSSRLDALT
ncbi:MULTISPECIES: M20 metallopeptidase family protein [Streptomyces]|uniref:Amidohydrolase n=2 Tax=Streptomyces TaxID=1883 RepID=A0ABU4K215_9ACTN|nr:amidohydrolase [Streptomyces roseolus]MDX2291804.1 amidohydrolase [Streptomyces roseolus]